MSNEVLTKIEDKAVWTPESLPTLTSPNGPKSKLNDSDDGTLSAVAVS